MRTSLELQSLAILQATLRPLREREDRKALVTQAKACYLDLEVEIGEVIKNILND